MIIRKNKAYFLAFALLFLSIYSLQAQNYLFSELSNLSSSYVPKAAFGVRKLNNTYNGPLLRIRQSTHGATADAAPDVNGNISSTSIVTVISAGTSGYTINQTMSLATFMGSANLFVAIWYDQSGNGYHVSQSNTATQPRLFLSGRINTLGALGFTSSSGQFLSFNGPVIPPQTTAKYTLNAVWNTSTTTNTAVVCEQNTTSIISSKRASLLKLNDLYGFNGQFNDAHTLASAAVNENIITSVVMDNALSNNVAVYKNSNAVVSGTTNGTKADLNNVTGLVFTIGKKGSANTEYWDGNIAEVVVFDQALNTTAQSVLLGNQGSYFRVPVALPTAPTSLVATNNNSALATTINLNWNAPAFDGGGNVTDYRIEYKRNIDNTWLVFNDGVSSLTSTTVTGLNVNTAYQFRVSAINSIGLSPLSSVASATTYNTCVITTNKVRYEVGQSITINLTSVSAFNGFVTLEYSGAGLSGSQTLNFSSSTTQSFTVTPTTIGTIELRATNQSPDIAPPVTYFITVATTANTLLSQVNANASATFGLRLLKADYSGALLRVRLSNNNAKGDVYPDSSGNMSTRSIAIINIPGTSTYTIGQTVLLETLISGNTPFVEIWYDQSGNGYHVSQSNTVAQPLLFLSGRINALGALSFTSSSGQFLSFNGGVIPPQTTAKYTLNAVWNTSSTTNTAVVCEQNTTSIINSKRASLLKLNNQYGFNGEANDAHNLASVAVNENIITSVVMDNALSNNVAVYKNSNAVVSGTTSGIKADLNNVTGLVFTIGKKGSANMEYWDGNIAEVVVFSQALNAATQSILLGNQGNYFRVPTVLPIAPASLVATNNNSALASSINLNWNAPAFDGGGNVTDYRIEYKRNTDSTWLVFNDGVSSLTSTIVTGLNASTTYQFRVSAINSVGTGSASSVANATTYNTCIIATNKFRFELGQSITINLNTVSAFNGFVTLEYRGAGLTGSQTLNFSSSTTQSFTVTPTTIGTIELRATSQSQDIVAPLTYFITVGTTNNTLQSQINVNASATFGLRLLKDDYSGALLRVRLSNNNAEGDVYPDSSGKISTRSITVISTAGTSTYAIGQTVLLETLISGNTPFVEIWYDQSGYNRNVSQLNNALQPTLNLTSSPAFIDFSNINTLLQSSSAATFLNNPYSIATVVQARRSVGNFACWAGTNANSNNAGFHFGWKNGTPSAITIAHFNNDANFTVAYTQNVTQQYTAVKNGAGGSSLYQNGILQGTSISPGANLNTSAVLNIGRGYDNFSPFGGYIFEMIFFSQALSNSERQSVECNQVSNLLPPQTATIAVKPLNICSLTSGPLGGNTNTNGFTGTWSQISGPGTITFSAVNSGASTATANQAGSYVLRWTITNTACSITSSDDVIVTFNNNVAMTLNTTATNAVINSSVKLNYSNVTNANQYNIVWNASALNAGFTNITNQPLAASGTTSFNIPGTVSPSTSYTGTIFPKDSISNCVGSGTNFTITTFYPFKGTTILLAGAYAIRNVNTAYSGPAIQVRRSSDNTTQNIGFTTQGNLDTVALKAFVGNSNGVVTIWYDQSGRNKHVGAASGREPQLVSAGTILLQNGRPAILFNGNHGFTLYDAILNAGTKTYTMNAVTNTTSTSLASLVEQNGIVNTSDKRAAILQYSSTAIGFNGQFNDAQTNLPPSPSNPFTITMVCNHNRTIGNVEFFLNGKANLLTTNNPSALDVGNSIFVIGYKPTSVPSEYWRGQVQEIILGAEAISQTDRVALQNSQAAYYVTPDSTQVIWVGNTSSNPSVSSNWSSATAPTSSTNIYIPNNVGNPLVVNNTLNVNTLSMANNANVSISSSGILRVAGSIINNGNRITNNGTLELTGTNLQTLPMASFNNAMFNNLTINNPTGVTISGTLNMKGLLTISKGTLFTNNNLILESSAASTASIGPLPDDVEITGNITVQRFIPSVTRRSRMLAAPTQQFTWQQLQDDIYISGTGGASNGFDATPTNSSTCYTYEEDPALGRGWKAATSTNQSVPVGKGMLVFIRGDRSLPAPQWYTQGQFPTQNAVTIDFDNNAINRGTIIPDVTYHSTSSISSDGINLVGNPYPSAISWSCLYAQSQNISSSYYIYNPTTGSYEAKTSGNIAIGQSFFIQAIGSNPIFRFTESCKVAEHNNTYFKNEVAPFKITVAKDSLNSDFVSFNFNQTYQKAFSFTEDALKVTNAVISIHTFADTLPVQINSCALKGSDTFALWIEAPTGTYALSADGFGQIPAGYQVWLIDHFNHSRIQLQSSTNYQFSINTAPQSKGNRFTLIIMQLGALPLKWLSFEGFLNEPNIALKWSTAQEYNCSHFEIERSFSGPESFRSIGLIQATGHQGAQNYTFTDAGIANGHATHIYYRIKQLDHDGNYTYSNIIHLSTLYNEAEEIQITPNPASANQTIRFDMPQVYGTQHEIIISDITGNNIKSLQLNSNVAFCSLAELNLKAGVYYVQITSNGVCRYSKLVIK